jgi:chromosome segregation ATPase
MSARIAAARKLKPAEPEPELDAVAAARGALSEVFDELAALRSAFDLNGRDLDAARQDIAQTEKDIAAAKEELEITPALQKRKLREKIQDLEAHLGELQEHKRELEIKRGHYPGCMQVHYASFETRLTLATQKAVRLRGEVLKAHPGVMRLIEEFQAKRAEVANLEATLMEIQKAGGIVDRSTDGFVAGNSWWSRWPMTFRAAPDLTWMKAIEALGSNAAASLPD